MNSLKLLCVCACVCVCVCVFLRQNVLLGVKVWTCRQMPAPHLQGKTDSFAVLVAQTVKNLPALWETQVQSLDQEDHLEKEMPTHSSILAWKIPWTEEPGRLQSMGLQGVRRD